MIIARKKRKENIAEYILYMWQVEDIIRANNLNITNVENNIIEKFDQSPEVKKQIREWYESLMEMMVTETIQTKGHLQINKNSLSLLTDFHKELLLDYQEIGYQNSFYKSLPYINELRQKNKEKDLSDIEICFNLMYGILLLRVQKKEISESTLQAAQVVSRFLAILSKKFLIISANHTSPSKCPISISVIPFSFPACAS